VPRRIPDLFAGQPVTVYGRMSEIESGTATLVGRVGEQRVEIPIRVDVSDARRTDGLASMWARRKIQELEDSRMFDPDAGPRVEAAVTEIALEHRVMSQYTSFVAIDDGRIANPEGTPARIDVPVEQVEGGITLAGTTSASRDYSAVVESSSATMVQEFMAPAESGAVFRLESGVRSIHREPPAPSEIAEKKLQRRVRQYRRRLRKCLDGDDGSRTLRAIIKVQPNGRIASVSFDGNAPDDEVERCLAREVLRWKVTRPGGHILSIEVLLDPDA
jgi:Ca-activated chloride channel family protein